MYDFFTISENACQVPFADLCKRKEEYRTYFIHKTYEPSQCIHSRGNRISSFGIVESGVLKAVSHTVNGAEHCHTYFETRDLFPEYLYFTGKREYAYTLVAEKKSEVIWIPIHVMEEMLEKDQQLMYALLLYVCQRGLKDQLYLNCLNYQTIRRRIAYWIVGMHNMNPTETIDMPCSQLVLANMLHVSRSSLNQELKLMQKDGYFKVKSHEIIDLDEERLNALI